MKRRQSQLSSIVFQYRRLIRRAVLAVVIVQSMIIAFALRFEFAIPEDKVALLYKGILLALAVKLPVLFLLNLDQGGWRNLEFSDFKVLFLGNFSATMVFAAVSQLVIGRVFPRSVYCIDFLLSFLITSGILLVIRLYHEPPHARRGINAGNILIYGAGTAGRSLLREILARPSSEYSVIGFLDDDPGKQRLRLDGVPVLGTGRETPAIVQRLSTKGLRIEEIVIAMPSIGGRRLNEVVANCRAAGVHCKIVPALVELLTGRVLAQVRDVSCEDLLCRQPVRLDLDRIRSMIRGQCILVTGGAGSIGSELCRQVARLEPAKLVVFEQAETELYRLERELTQKFPRVHIVPEIGTIRSFPRIWEVIHEHRADTVFHAAAYKHVPMMELHALEAVENNVVGTHNVVEAAFVERVKSFVMISSDKAVNPTNIMGLTKRVAELLVASMPRPVRGVGTKFVSVRFGNVLGSNGSVVPLFREQIAAGGPVTVTHPQMRRYFMTIPEAVQLVLEASPVGEGGEIFVLEMGEPVRIVDLAENMIRLSGRNPEEVEIRFTGLRPGEKLFEEVCTNSEHVLPTLHPKIQIFQGPAPSRIEMLAWLKELHCLIDARDRCGIIYHLASLVPEYTPSAHSTEAYGLVTACAQLPVYVS